MQVDRLLEALSIWKEDREKLMEHRSLCATAGKEVCMFDSPCDGIHTPPTLCMCSHFQLAAPKPHPMLIAKGDIQVGTCFRGQ